MKFERTRQASFDRLARKRAQHGRKRKKRADWHHFIVAVVDEVDEIVAAEFALHLHTVVHHRLGVPASVEPVDVNR